MWEGERGYVFVCVREGVCVRKGERGCVFVCVREGVCVWEGDIQ